MADSRPNIPTPNLNQNLGKMPSKTLYDIGTNPADIDPLDLTGRRKRKAADEAHQASKDAERKEQDHLATAEATATAKAEQEAADRRRLALLRTGYASTILTGPAATGTTSTLG